MSLSIQDINENRAKALSQIFMFDNAKYNDINLPTIISAAIRAGIVPKDYQGTILLHRGFFKVTDDNIGSNNNT